MSYQKGLDEHAEEDLQAELDRRYLDRERGLCDYCHFPPEAPTCRFQFRHFASKPKRSPPNVKR